MAVELGTKMVIREETINNSKRVNNNDVRRTSEASSDRARELEKARQEENLKREENRKALLEEQQKAATLDSTRGKVISESKDGDTVRASQKAMDAVKDGIVLPKESDEEVTDLTGYSSKQIDTLYKEGKISRETRDKEIRKREELKKQLNEDQDKKEIRKEPVKVDTTADTKAADARKNDEKKAEAAKDQEARNREAQRRNDSLAAEQENFKNFESNMNDLIGQQMRQGLDPNLERFGTVEGFNVSITQ
jgi:hypothetical protein